MPLPSIDHKAIAVALLPEKFAKPLISGLLEALVGESQIIEDVAVRIPEETLGIDEAVGVQLEQLALLVGAQVIAGSEDATRALIRTNIRANRSRGSLNDVIAVLVLVPLPLAIVLEDFPAAIRVTVFLVSSEVAPIVARVLMLARAAGVRLDLIASEVAQSATFQYSSQSATTESSATFGYGSGVYPAYFSA